MIEIIPNWHPVFVHFPIAFTTAAVFFFMVASLFREKQWAAQCLITGRWMLWAATIFACVAAVFGWFAYNSVKHDEAGHLAMTLHRNWALATLGVLVLLSALDLRFKRSIVQPSYGFLALLVTGWLLVVSTAWHGGEVVFRHGLGVMSLPKPEGPGHTHDQRESHGEELIQGEEMSHVDGHGHDDTANDGHPLDSEPMSTTPNADSAGTVTIKPGHTHAPGTPPHQD